MTKDLVALSYQGYSDIMDQEVQGLLLVYKDFKMAFAVEQTLEQDKKVRDNQVAAFDQLKSIICQV